MGAARLAAPGLLPVAMLLATLALAAAGTIVRAEVRGRPGAGGRVGDVIVAVDRTGYVHHPEDDARSPFPMPPGMMPGMPDEGLVRLSAELTISNVGPGVARHRATDLEVRTASGGRFVAVLADATEVALRPGETVVTVIGFDVPEGDAEPRLVLARDGEELALALPPAPLHRRARRAPWPGSAAELPAGDPARGARLFAGRLACVSCHGSPSAPGTELLGPGLAAVAGAAAGRVPGKSAAQYLYESILEPDAFLAPACAGGRPCASPSQMPRYGSALGPEEMADLLAFLLDRSG